MLPKPRRPRERCIYPLSRVTYSVPEYCDITGLTRKVVLRLMDEGSLPSVKIGIRRLILMRQLPQRHCNPRASEKSN